MLIQTRHFGEINVQDEGIITFPKGLIAFEDVSRFALIHNEDSDLPFHWLQGVDQPDLTFVVLNPFLFRKDYQFDIPKDTLTLLDIQTWEEVGVYTIVVVPEDLKKMTANLLAPLVINTRTRKGKQIVLQDNRYTTKHYIMEELRRTDGGGV